MLQGTPSGVSFLCVCDRVRISCLMMRVSFVWIVEVEFGLFRWLAKHAAQGILRKRGREL